MTSLKIWVNALFIGIALVVSIYYVCFVLMYEHFITAEIRKLGELGFRYQVLLP